MAWGPPAIRLLVPPHHGVHLLAWGRHPAGRWWALVTWERWMARHFESPTCVWCTGWTAAANVQRLETEDYRNVTRVTLDNDPAWWPTPPGPQRGHFGVLEAATPLDPPSGYRWVAPRFSKR